MKKAIAIFLLISVVLALCGCAEGSPQEPSEQPSEPPVTQATERTPAPAYDGDLPAGLFGIYDEESYTNNYFGIVFKRDGNWTFYSQQELASLNVGATEAAFRSKGFVYDMYARNNSETLGFTVAIPSVQFGREMTEDEYAQAIKEASARDYAGADYDVVSDEIGTAQINGETHVCYYLTVAANGMVFYSAQLFLQRDGFIGVAYVSAQSEEARASLLNSFR